MDPTELRQKAYELKVGYLTAHLARMWQRFNFFIVLEGGLLATAVNTKHHSGVQALLVAELVVSLIWYVFGAQDKYLVEVYREAVKHSGRALLPNELAAGEIPPDPTELGVRRGLLQWRFKGLSITHLAAAFPLGCAAAWAIALAVY